jgi:hypothetical protein
VPAGELELPRLDVDAHEADAREFLAEYREYRTDATADLEQPCTGLEVRPVADQPVPPVLGLLDQPLLFGRGVSVNVAGHDRCGLASSNEGLSAIP